MTSLRDDANEFEGAIAAAAGELGLAPLFIEKDYWVTQVLRALNARHPGWFVFKGGTSLSKGYGLIERFSEDVDILVSPAKDDSARTREGLLLAMTESVADELGVQWLEGRAPGRGRLAHRADVLVYPRTVRGTIVPMEDRGVLLETGFAGGEWPGEMVSITPMLCEPLGIDPVAYEDTTAFYIKALKPVRTLLEKLSLLHHVASHHGETGAHDPRCGRHYYDVYRLLDHAPTRTALDDRGQFRRILSEMKHISAQHFGGWTARPDDGYASSPAFAPASGSELRKWLQARYDEAAELMPARTAGRWPTFGQVLSRVRDREALL